MARLDAICACGRFRKAEFDQCAFCWNSKKGATRQDTAGYETAYTGHEAAYTVGYLAAYEASWARYWDQTAAASETVTEAPADSWDQSRRHDMPYHSANWDQSRQHEVPYHSADYATAIPLPVSSGLGKGGDVAGKGGAMSGMAGGAVRRGPARAALGYNPYG